MKAVGKAILEIPTVKDLKERLAKCELLQLAAICQSIGRSGRGNRAELTQSIVGWYQAHQEKK